jgi:Uma2 family endonuclease
MARTKSKSTDPTRNAAAMVNGATPIRRLRLTPAWAGRDVSLEEFEGAIAKEGWRYELIDERIEVFPVPQLPHDLVVEWINDRLRALRDVHREVINYVSGSSRVFIPGRREATCLQPDLAAFRDYPTRWPRQMRRWQDMKPLLVVQVLSEGYHQKDLVRNVALYREAPSVREYWVLNPLDGGDHPTLRVYRRRGSGAWQRPIDVPFGGTYTTPLLPGFILIVDASV